MTKVTNIVDTRNPAANMYGCLPCPKCKSKFRFTANGRYTKILVGKPVIVCDDCQFEEEPRPVHD